MIRDVLKTKIAVPPGQAGWISRPRLTRLLNSREDRALVVVCAPAGFGKTTMLSEWANSGQGRFSWLSLDEGDNDPLRFWIHFISSLKMCRPGFGTATLEMLQSYAPSLKLPADTCLTGLINELFEESTPVTMILDDFQLVTNQAIHDDLRFLIDHMPSRFRLVVSSRVRPPLPVGRLRIRNRLTMISADDLRFTPQEIALLARRVAGGKLSDADMSALEAYSEGWAAGLQHAVTAMKKGPEGTPVLSRGYEHMVEYFMEEVLASHPEHIRSFLLETSILGRLSGPLCDAVTGREDSAELLASLYEGNSLIVALDHQAREYRYHALFAEALRGRLGETDPGRVSALHSRAARWFIENGYPDDAIRHAIEAGDWDLAADLVNRHAAIALSRGESSLALGWMQSLPARCFNAHAGLCTGYAWALFLSNLGNRTGMPYDTIEHLLNDAQKAYLEKNYGSAPVSGHDRRVLSHANALKVYLAYERGEPAQKVIDLCSRSLGGAGADSPIERAGVYTVLGMTYLSTGSLESARKAFDEARSIGFVEGTGFILVTVDCLRTFLAKIRGRLRESESMCHDSIQALTETFIGHGRLLPEMLGLIRLVVASIYLEEGRMQAAGEILQEIGPSIRMLDYSIIMYNAVLSRLRLNQGAELRSVLAPLTEIGLMEESCPGAMEYSVALNIRSVLQRQGTRPSAVESAFRMAERHGLSLSGSGGISSYPFAKYWHYTGQFSLIRLHLVEGRVKPAGLCRVAPGEIVRCLGELCMEIREEGWGELEIEGLMLLAEAHYALGDEQEALLVLEHAFSLAEPQGYERLFVEEGARIRDLLQHARNQGICREFSGRLLEALRREHREDAGPAARRQDLFNGRIEPLSRQEVNVLKLIADGLSNQEIADELCVALTTVKVHNYNIFGKLNVRKRFHAVRKARELNLL